MSLAHFWLGLLLLSVTARAQSPPSRCGSICWINGNTFLPIDPCCEPYPPPAGYSCNGGPCNGAGTYPVNACTSKADCPAGAYCPGNGTHIALLRVYPILSKVVCFGAARGSGHLLLRDLVQLATVRIPPCVIWLYCVLCLVGTYQPLPGQPSCLKCPAGLFLFVCPAHSCFMKEPTMISKACRRFQLVSAAPSEQPARVLDSKKRT